MKILLLGSQGNLAGALTEIGADRNDIELIGWDKGEVDVTDRGLLEKKITELKPAIIINTVAYNDVDRCENEEGVVLARKLNIEVPKALAEIALDQSCLLIHYSTDYVFSGEDGPYDENSETSPLSVYGDSKAKGERELIRLSGRGLKYYLIRTSRLFGAKGEGETAKPSFFDIMSKLAERQPVIKAVNDEKGSFTYTVDLANATFGLIDTEASYGIYHVVNSGTASWYDAARYLFTKRESAVELEAVAGTVFERAARRPKNSTLVSTKLPPLRSWQEALDEYISRT